jgi:catechol 2,3-dioxygenase-like lactoylglutathione lyase family enzyme
MNVRLDMIGIAVKDIATSVAFYRALGLEIPEPDGRRRCTARDRHKSGRKRKDQVGRR